MLITVILNLIIITRLSFLCIYKKDYYNQILYENNNILIEGMTAPRGRILDINGNILVDNIGVKSIIYNKLNIGTSKELEIAKTLSENIELEFSINKIDLQKYYYLLNKEKVDKLVSKDTLKAYEERKLTSSELYNRKLNLITDAELATIDSKAAYFYYLMNNGYSYEDKIIKTNITNEEYILINELNIDGIRTDITWERTYPYGGLLKEVFGSVSTYNQGLTSELKAEYLEKGYKLNDRIGINNLEYIYDEYLRGTKAKYKLENNKLSLISEYEKGKDLILSIDINLQISIEEILEEEMLKAKKVINSKYYNQSYLIVSNPNDGSIMALVGKKLNSDNTFTDYSYYTVLNSYTLGSVVKGATISVGYKNNIIDEKSKFADGCVTLFSQKPKCSWTKLGVLNDINALKWSSNYFQYRIAIGLTGNTYKPNIKINATTDHFAEYRSVLASYGLGTLTGVDLSKESTGQKGSIISDDLLLNLAIGQYDTYTPISLSQYINTIASGKRTEVSLLKSVVDNDGSIYYEKENKVLNQVPIDEFYLNRIREGFKAVNASGTAYSYTNHKFSSAGKSGTSESFLDSDFDGNVDTLTTTTTYAMFAPYENPEVSIIIVSPNMRYKNNLSSYKYPLNANVVRKVSAMIFK